MRPVYKFLSDSRTLKFWALVPLATQRLSFVLLPSFLSTCSVMRTEIARYFTRAASATSAA